MFTRLVLVMLLLLSAASVSAQEVRLDVLADGVLVQIALNSNPQAPLASVQTDAVGIFSWTGAAQTDYQVRAGDTTARVTTGEAPPQPFQWPPIYITLGALLLLSLIPARLLRRPEVR
jgi:phosphate-selective porin